MPKLRVDFCGEVHMVGPSSTLQFGRAAGLTIDEANPYMHRLVGQFRNASGMWWLDNLGSTIGLSIVANSGTRVHLPPPGPSGARSATLTESSFAVEFRAGTLDYRIDVAVEDGPQVEPPPGPSVGTDTVAHGRVQLTVDDRRLLTALARGRLLDPLADPTSLPSNREVAHRFDWKITTYNRKLDRLCERFGKAGVVGLQGSRGAEAANRRWVLVEHAVSSGLITIADLAE